MPACVVIDCRRIKDFGVGTYIRNLTRELARLDKSTNYKLVADRSEFPHFKDFPPNFEAVHYQRPDSEPLDDFRFPLFVRRFSADLCHLPVHSVPAMMPKPYIVTVHDLSTLLYEQGEGWRRQLRLSRVQRGLRRASKIIAVSAATRRDVINLLGIPGAKIRKIYNAPDPRFVERSTAADARTAGPGATSRYRQRILERYQVHYPFILYVGNIRPQKNVTRLVESFAVLRGQLTEHPLYKDLRLIIIGDESTRVPSLRLAVMQSRVDKVVRFLGFVPIDTLRVFYEAASAFAFPSLYEGFGLPPLEAMAAGTPVVTSGVSSLPEVVGDAAVIVNPENVFDIARGLRDALLNEELRAGLIARGFEQVKRFSWSRTAAEVLESYRELVPRVAAT